MKGYFFSANRGFLHSDIHPIEASDVPLTDENYHELRIMQSTGHTIIAGGDGRPVAVKDTLSAETVEARRAAAYANPVTGSDRLFAEAQRLQLVGDETWRDVLEKAVARYNEIREQNPWPEQ